MQLINTLGMAFIGPGSEWFWSMLHLFAIVITLVALYHQVRLQTSQAAADRLTSFEEVLRSERITRYKLEVLVALRDGASPAEVPPAAVDAISLVFFKAATLARRGQVDRNLVWRALGPACAFWWPTLEPSIRAERVALSDPTLADWFEWLAGVLAEMDRKAGKGISYDEAGRAAAWENAIRSYEGQLRVEQALRSVIVASPDAPTVGQPTAPAVAAPAVGEG